jgi:hypothetical protein
MKVATVRRIRVRNPQFGFDLPHHFTQPTSNNHVHCNCRCSGCSASGLCLCGTHWLHRQCARKVLQDLKSRVRLRSCLIAQLYGLLHSLKCSELYCIACASSILLHSELMISFFRAVWIMFCLISRSVKTTSSMSMSGKGVNSLEEMSGATAPLPYW